MLFDRTWGAWARIAVKGTRSAIRCYVNYLIRYRWSRWSYILKNAWKNCSWSNVWPRYRWECLDWSESGFCKGCENYEIIQDTDDSIAGTHGAWGSSEEDGEWTSNCFFFAKKMGGKIVEWYVHARPIVD
ncbi:hypothetical protein N9P90_00870 [bacterium]|nr:hypothetical protein [bacterium]